MQSQIDVLVSQFEEAKNARNYKRALEIERLIECAKEFLKEAR